MNARQARPSTAGSRRFGVSRRLLVLGVVLAVFFGGGLSALAAVTVSGGDRTAPAWRSVPAGPPSESPAAAASQPSPTPAEQPKSISLSATGDIIMGDAPGRLPARGGAGFFDAVRRTLAADLVMGNLEEPLTEDTGHAKCGAGSSGCHQFRAPPSYAAHLRDAGFELLNQANNHSNDFGPAGFRNTQKVLEKHGLRHTGARGEITVVEVEGVRVAVLGFSSYAASNSLLDVDAAKRIVRAAVTEADLVVVQVHMGAEGSGMIHVRPGEEIFLGENRGDPIRFSHAVIDAGADLVVGHGPHVMRALEFYRGRLIAYSLGNFAGGAGTLDNSGRLGWGAVLKVSLRPDGGWAGGQFLSTYMNGAGRPIPDPRKRGLDLVRGLCAEDFPKTGARLAPDGRILTPSG